MRGRPTKTGRVRWVSPKSEPASSCSGSDGSFTVSTSEIGLLLTEEARRAPVVSDEGDPLAWLPKSSYLALRRYDSLYSALRFLTIAPKSEEVPLGATRRALPERMGRGLLEKFVRDQLAAIHQLRCGTALTASKPIARCSNRKSSSNRNTCTYSRLPGFPNRASSKRLKHVNCSGSSQPANGAA